MRTVRTFLAAAVVALLAACAAETPSPVLPADQSLRDGTGWGGSDNSTGTDTTATDTTVSTTGTGWGGSDN